MENELARLSEIPPRLTRDLAKAGTEFSIWTKWPWLSIAYTRAECINALFGQLYNVNLKRSLWSFLWVATLKLVKYDFRLENLNVLQYVQYNSATLSHVMLNCFGEPTHLKSHLNTWFNSSWKSELQYVARVSYRPPNKQLKDFRPITMQEQLRKMQLYVGPLAGIGENVYNLPFEISIYKIPSTVSSIERDAQKSPYINSP
jgi:hypothetical protein